MADAIATPVQQPSEYEQDVSFFDVQIHLELRRDVRPRTVKAYALPVEYASLMPWQWDAAGVERSISPDEFLSGTTLKPKSETFVDKLQPLGRTEEARVYAMISEAVKEALRQRLVPPPADPKLLPLGDTTLKVPALKLLLAAYFYGQTAVEESAAREQLELLLDKLLLLAVLPLIISDYVLDKTLPATGSVVQPDAPVAVINNIAGIIKQDDRLKLDQPLHTKLFDDGSALKFAKADWQELVAQSRNARLGEVVLIPLNYLEEQTRQALEERYTGLVQSLPQDLRARLDAIFQATSPTARKDYGFFYDVIDQLWQKWEVVGKTGSLNLHKLRYRSRMPLLPFIQEIDARPPVWKREAQALAVENAIAMLRREQLLTKLNAPGEDPATFDATARDLRQANRALFEVRHNIEMLKDELQDSGYKLIEDKPLGQLPFKEFNVGCDALRQRTVYIPREVVRRWTEMVAEPVRFGPFRVGTRYVARTHTDVQRWTEVRIETYTETVPSDVEWRPVQNNLAHALPEQSYQVRNPDGTVNSEATKEVTDKLTGLLNKPDLTKALNRDKDVRLLTLFEGGYRDQYGYSLENLLAMAEDEDVRARLLLVVPLYERSIDGGADVVKYMAVHNPMAPRKSFLEPRVFLVETYKQVLAQQPGHWLGPLSHSVCLFPGEVRKLKLLSETRLVTQQKQEMRSTQRSAVEQKASVRTQVRQDMESVRKDAKQSNWNVSASGGVNFGFWNAGASGGGGSASQSSQEDVAKSINDRVAESMQGVSQSNEVQFATTSETTLTQSSSSEQVVEFQNVNQGRSVTHKFFQILNRYRSSIQLHDARVVIEYGEQLLPGLDLFRTAVYPIADLDKMFPEVFPDERARAVDEIKRLVKERLGSGKNSVSEKDGAIQFTPNEIDGREWFVNSGACFVDTQVSLAPATEPYVEDARTAEIEIQRARVERIKKEGEAVVAGRLVIPSDLQGLRLSLDQSNGEFVGAKPK